MKKLLTRLLGTYLNALIRIAPRMAGRHGFFIMCYPFRTPIKKHHKPFLQSGEAFSFYSEGTKIQGYKWGKGSRKILFLHGWQSHSFRWKNYIQELSPEEYTLYALDAPGHGASGGSILSVPIYSKVISHFISTAGSLHAVVAHSMGSFSVLHALHSEPSLQVGKLVLMASPGEGMDFVKYFKRSLKLSRHVIDEVLAYFARHSGSSMEIFSTSRFAASLQMPGLIIHDEEDLVTPYECSLKIHRSWPKASFLSTRGLKHNLKSSSIVQAVCNFVHTDTGQEVLQGNYNKQEA